MKYLHSLLIYYINSVINTNNVERKGNMRNNSQDFWVIVCIRWQLIIHFVMKGHQVRQNDLTLFQSIYARPRNTEYYPKIGS